jgi:hypothetical protein
VKYQASLDEDAKQCLGSIATATHRMQKNIVDTLEYGRIQPEAQISELVY